MRNTLTTCTIGPPGNRCPIVPGGEGKLDRNFRGPYPMLAGVMRAVDDSVPPGGLRGEIYVIDAAQRISIGNENRASTGGIILPEDDALSEGLPGNEVTDAAESRQADGHGCLRVALTVQPVVLDSRR